MPPLTRVARNYRAVSRCEASTGSVPLTALHHSPTDDLADSRSASMSSFASASSEGRPPDSIKPRSLPILWPNRSQHPMMNRTTYTTPPKAAHSARPRPLTPRSCDSTPPPPRNMVANKTRGLLGGICAPLRLAERRIYAWPRTKVKPNQPPTASPWTSAQPRQQVSA